MKKHFVAGGIAAVAVIGGVAVNHQGGGVTRAPVRGAVLSSAPTDAVICTPGYPDTVRPSSSYTTSLKIKQMTQWHLGGKTSDYEEDHLISLELGGDPRSPDNLWPQKWPEARKKDQEENALHRDVCAGRMTLGAAQEKIRRDWAKK